MKKLLIAVALGVVAVSPVNAKTSKTKTNQTLAPFDLSCDDIAEITKSVMQLRQANAPIQDAMRLADGSFTGVNRIVVKGLTIDAYSHPLYSTDEYKQREITEYSNNKYVGCMLETAKEVSKYQ